MVASEELDKKIVENINEESENRKMWANVNRNHIIVLTVCFAIVLWIMMATIGGFSWKHFLMAFAGYVIGIIILLMTERGREPYKEFEAVAISRENVRFKQYHAKDNPTEIPQGEVNSGHTCVRRDPYTNEPLYWMVGITIRSERGQTGGHPDCYVARVEWWKGGVGFLGLEKLESDFKGDEPEFFSVPFNPAQPPQQNPR